MFGMIKKLKQGLNKTHESLTDKVKGIFAKHEVDEDLLEELEEALIKADVSIEITMDLIDKIRKHVNDTSETNYDAYGFLKDELLPFLPEEASPDEDFQVMLILGVNGSGKTTSIAKLAHLYKQQGHSVLLAAADTFRAAATEQLCRWADKVQVPIVKKEEGADPGAVIFEALELYASKGYNRLIIDTAGRLHTKKNLMDELAKMKRIIHKSIPEAHVHTRLVLDATSGNNGLAQAREFAKDIGIDDLLLAKLDSSAKGGFIFSIAKDLSLPVRYIGIGETVEDLLPFSKKDFVEALFD